MSPTRYSLYRHVNRPIEYRGLTGIYIVYLIGGIILLLVIVAILRAIGASIYVCAGVVLVVGGSYLQGLYRHNKRNGQHGAVRRRRRGGVPEVIRVRSREIYFGESIEGKEELLWR